MTKLASADLRGFGYFIAVAEEKTLAAAARRLHMAQPPLSVQIRKLEDRVGVPLFDRGSAGMALNEAGRAFYARARDAMQLAQDGFDAALAIGSGRRGRLKVGILHALCYEYLPSLSTQLLHALPDVDCAFEELDASAVQRSLDERRVDVALCMPAGPQPGLHSLRCGRQPYRVALARTAAPADGSGLTLAALAALPLIVLPAGDDEAEAAGVLRIFRAAGLVPRVAHRVQTVHGALARIRAGQGVALLPDSVRPMLPPEVVLRPLADAAYDVDVALRWREDAPAQALIGRFAEVVQPLLDR